LWRIGTVARLGSAARGVVIEGISGRGKAQSHPESELRGRRSAVSALLAFPERGAKM